MESDFEMVHSITWLCPYEYPLLRCHTAIRIWRDFKIVQELRTLHTRFGYLDPLPLLRVPWNYQSNYVLHEETIFRFIQVKRDVSVSIENLCSHRLACDLLRTNLLHRDLQYELECYRLLKLTRVTESCSLCNHDVLRCLLLFCKSTVPRVCIHSTAYY